MLADETIELLDRQHNYFQRQSGRRIFLAVRRYFEVLRDDPRLRPLLEDLESDAFKTLDAFAASERSLSQRLVVVRDEFVRREPSADDSSLTHDRPGYAESLANFDAHASSVAREPTPPDLEDEHRGDRSAVDTMLRILREKLEDLRFYQGSPPSRRRLEHDLRPDLEDLESRRAEIAGEYYAVLRAVERTAAGGAAFSVLRLRYLAAEAGDEWPVLDTDRRRWVLAVFRQNFRGNVLVVLDQLFLRLFPPTLVGDITADLVDAAERVREEEDLLHDELRRQVGTTRSRYAVVDRFRQRCEWYDQAQLVQLADQATGQAEAALTAVLARYLFDQDLNPISRPMTGRLEPDLLDPSLEGGFYVEAKQYTSSARDYLKRGVWQAHDTMATLASTRYAVREGFYVVFRRGGPRYVFPEILPGERWQLYPVLIDLSPDVGSRARQQPRVLTEEELAPRKAARTNGDDERGTE
jgi:hypothetical protein